jgi:hypothetical protein
MGILPYMGLWYSCQQAFFVKGHIVAISGRQDPVFSVICRCNTELCDISIIDRKQPWQCVNEWAWLFPYKTHCEAHVVSGPSLLVPNVVDTWNGVIVILLNSCKIHEQNNQYHKIIYDKGFRDVIKSLLSSSLAYWSEARHFPSIGTTCDFVPWPVPVHFSGAQSTD